MSRTRAEIATAAENRKERLEHCRRVLYGYRAGEPISDEDSDFLFDIISTHPDADRKIGVGIARFEVGFNPLIPTKPALWLVRLDGSRTDFSFMKCLDGAGSVRHRVLTALRAEVIDQIVVFKKQGLASGLVCALTGVALDDSCHVDHEPRFELLADEFIGDRGGYDAIELAPAADGMIGRRLANGFLAAEWREFHRSRAGLRLVTANANLTRLRR